MLHTDITEKIIGSFYNVYNELGFGFLEKVYENALCHEMITQGLYVERQKNLQVQYKDIIAGNYFADIVVEGKVIVELKAAEGLVEEHELQLINYLKATDLEVGLLLNFGKKPQFKRKIFENTFKTSLKTTHRSNYPRISVK